MKERERLCEEIQREYQRFYQDIMILSPEEIWERCRKIQFYCCIQEYFEFNEGVEETILSYVSTLSSRIETMWEFYLKHEFCHCDTWEDITGMLATMIIQTLGGKEPWQMLKVS